MFDLIGDVHGCFRELCDLLEEKLGYVYDKETATWFHPENRQVVFVGDLVDRGPYSPEVLSMVMKMVESGCAFMVLGNHDNKLMRYLKGNKVTVAHGLQETIDQLNARSDAEEFKSKVHDFLAHQPIKLSLDDGRLHVVHAAAPSKYHGELTGKKKKAQKAFALYGVTTGKTIDGFPERVDWAQTYDGEAVVVHGHVAQKEATRVNNVFNVDTACVYGNKLTALRYPELELVSVNAHEAYRGDWKNDPTREKESPPAAD